MRDPYKFQVGNLSPEDPDTNKTIIKIHNFKVKGRKIQSSETSAEFPYIDRMSAEERMAAVLFFISPPLFAPFREVNNIPALNIQ